MAEKTYTRADLEALAHQIAVRKGVDPTLVKAVIDTESGWNPRAQSYIKNKKTGKMEPAAAGLMQLMPNTARDLGLHEKGDDPAGLNRYDPAKNLEAGITYLSQQLRRFGDVGLALTAYNAGPAVAARVESDPRAFPLATETQNYIPSVFKSMGKYGDPLMPSAVTIALFPGVKGAITGTVADQVNQRTGGATPRSIEQTLRAGKAVPPTPPPAAPQMSGPGMATAPPQDVMAAAPAQDVMATGSAAPMATQNAPQIPSVPPARPAPEAAQNPLALLSATAGKQPTLDAYLRSQFGPVADVADPFPRSFDRELTRLIDRA